MEIVEFVKRYMVVFVVVDKTEKMEFVVVDKMEFVVVKTEKREFVVVDKM